MIIFSKVIERKQMVDGASLKTGNSSSPEMTSFLSVPTTREGGRKAFRALIDGVERLSRSVSRSKSRSRSGLENIVLEGKISEQAVETLERRFKSSSESAALFNPDAYKTSSKSKREKEQIAQNDALEMIVVDSKSSENLETRIVYAEEKARFINEGKIPASLSTLIKIMRNAAAS